MKLKDILRDKLSEDELDCLIQSYDVVGDMSIIIVPPELAHRESLIGEAILDAHPTIHVVAKRVGSYGGEHRTIQLQVIAGENRKETIHKEYGIKFKLNPEEVYFSVRSSTERKRIANQVKNRETVLVMFSGIAPYPLYIEKFSKADAIIGIESNPEAHRYAQENLLLNKIRAGIELYNGDVTEIVPQLGLNFDRIVMPLPISGSDYLSLALDNLNPGGFLHHYVMQQADTLDHAILYLSDRCKQASRTLAHYDVTVCGHTAPKTFRYCIDALIH